jgi:hypothetical protein
MSVQHDMPGRRMVTMAKLRVHNLSGSLDGYAAGPDQGTGNPLGVGGEQLHEWIFPAGGTAGLDGGPATIRQYLQAASSTNCTWRSRPSCSAAANGSSTGTTRPDWTWCRSARRRP